MHRIFRCDQQRFPVDPGVTVSFLGDMRSTLPARRAADLVVDLLREARAHARRADSSRPGLADGVRLAGDRVGPDVFLVTGG